MSAHSWYLLALLVASIVVLVTLINSRLKFHPFVALMVVSVAVGIFAGEPAAKIGSSIESGAGGILGNVGVTLALGAMLGRLLSDSGATDRIATAIVDRSSTAVLPYAMGAAAFVIGVPMFFEIGLIVLLPLVFSVAQRVREERPEAGSPYTMLVVPTIAALATLHGMVPPHPGPLVAVDGLHANLGKTIVLGLLCAIPTVIVSGPLYARFISRRVEIEPDAALVAQFTTAAAGPTNALAGTGVPVGSVHRSVGEGEPKTTRQANMGLAICAILIPVVLMLFQTVVQVWFSHDSDISDVATLVGTPVVAMLIGFLFALFALGFGTGQDGETLRRSVSESLKAVVGILLIIGGGGAFNGVLETTGIGGAIASAASHTNVNVIVLGWLLALLLSASTGSATVGIVSATGIVAPLVHDGSSWHTSLVVLAIGAGSIGLNYVNHAGFWLVKESFGMSMTNATKVHTAVQTLVSVVAFICILVLSIFIH
ncbi:GntP family permease [Rudaeicoccus suwonensis]|uniref:GntP family gluconate:H+ symporter n=1 Tax=Rudaeicoccus suwonensis TaxID=657409 RepID=A0A561E3T1_9MICO|nr:gluconate:H+ symporter [Rudaeicoccus suwonensis]TWE10274.1 GntP family gluconate:H+ symporter [Rudaeicoccus suwonensis]